MKILKILKNIIYQPHSTIRYWLFSKLNYDEIHKKKFDRHYKILKYFKIHEKMYPPQFHDLENLINVVKKTKPRKILEFGGGYSTIAFCYAISELKKNFNINAKLYSYDQNEDYLNITKKIIPDEYKQYVNFIYSPLEVKNVNGINMNYFKKLEIINYDLIYEDRYNSHNAYPNCDIIKIIEETNFFPNIIFDGHWSDVHYYKNKYKNHYKIKISEIFKRANFLS